MCMTDYDSPTVYSESQRVARKSHRCDECQRVIDAGEKYCYVFSIYEGDPCQSKTCLQCKKGQDLLLIKCRGFLHCGIYEDLKEHVYCGVDWAMTAARIVVGMKRKWKRFDGNGLMKPIEV